jgi:DNA polymerase-3 subunit epsilon
VRPGRSQAAYGYAVVDLEASGSSSRRHRVVEVAVVLLDAELRPEGEFTTLVDPQGPVGPTHIHGIEAAHLAGAPRFAEVAGRLLRLLNGRVLVGHNVGCDRAFLAAEFARLGVELPPLPELCTMRLAAGLGDQAADGLSLGACAAAAGITGWDPHTALGDARATAALLLRYAPRVPGLPELLAAAGALRRAAGPLSSPAVPPAPSLPLPHDALWVRRPLGVAAGVRAGGGTRGAVPGGANGRADGTSGRDQALVGANGGGGVNDPERESVPEAREGSA